jgi:hypothetical protein
MRAALIQLDDRNHIFVTALHHIVCDGWSIGVLSNELKVLCDNYSRGVPSSLPEVSIQYADYAS